MCYQYGKRLASNYSVNRTQTRYAGSRRLPLALAVKSLLLAIVLFALIGFAGAAAAPQSHARVTGIYSNLQYNAEAGDLLGMELLIIPATSGYVACVQVAEGGAPFVAVVPISISGTQVQFILPPSYGGQHITGSFSGGKLVLHWPKGQQEVLSRGKSYWQ